MQTDGQTAGLQTEESHALDVHSMGLLKGKVPAAGVLQTLKMTKLYFHIVSLTFYLSHLSTLVLLVSVCLFFSRSPAWSLWGPVSPPCFISALQHILILYM